MVHRRAEQNTICVILGGGRGTRLYPLTTMRAKPAVPLGGKYRLIDVPISNCLNSGINQMYVLTQFESASLHRHVKETYRFDRFSAGFVEILAAQQRYDTTDWYQGTADAVRQNLDHFAGDWDEMLILSGDQLYRMDFRLLMAQHRQTKADMTIAVLPVSAKDASSLGIVKVNEQGRVVEFHEKPTPERLAGLETNPAVFERFGLHPEGRPFLASMGIYLFDRKVLIDELTEHHFVDFGKNLFPSCIDKHQVQTYVFDGYWEDIGTVKSFHEANLKLAQVSPSFGFNNEFGLIYTRPRTLPGTIVGKLSSNNSIIADGCHVVDAELDESILGLRSYVGRNVRLSRALVMGADFYEYTDAKVDNRVHGRPDIGIGDNVVIENAIVDKNVRIGSDVVLRGHESVQPSDGPFYAVRDGLLCIFKGATIHSGTRVGDTE